MVLCLEAPPTRTSVGLLTSAPLNAEILHLHVANAPVAQAAAEQVAVSECLIPAAPVAQEPATSVNPAAPVTATVPVALSACLMGIS